jgi:hypothetical protein
LSYATDIIDITADIAQIDDYLAGKGRLPRGPKPTREALMQTRDIYVARLAELKDLEAVEIGLATAAAVLTEQERMAGERAE